LKTQEELAVAKFNQELSERRRAFGKAKARGRGNSPLLRSKNARDHQALDKESAKARAEKEGSRCPRHRFREIDRGDQQPQNSRDRVCSRKFRDLSLGMATREKELQSKNVTPRTSRLSRQSAQPDVTLVISRPPRFAQPASSPKQTADYIHHRHQLFTIKKPAADLQSSSTARRRQL